jgi:hypothetical protein
VGGPQIYGFFLTSWLRGPSANGSDFTDPILCGLDKLLQKSFSPYKFCHKMLQLKFALHKENCGTGTPKNFVVSALSKEKDNCRFDMDWYNPRFWQIFYSGMSHRNVRFCDLVKNQTDERAQIGS